MHQGQQECCRGENILEAAIAQDDVKWLMSRQDQKKAQSRTSWEGVDHSRCRQVYKTTPQTAGRRSSTRAAAIGNYQNDFDKEKDQT